ncbi:MAG: DnaJ C-terminal domain-containing protein [Chloroflexota bacterium]
MEYKDYYKILGVDRKTEQDAIKRAYRKLALKYHPDRNPGNKQAEEKFKEINEAYQVLGDPEKRARFDQLGTSYERWQRMGGRPESFNWGEWFTASPTGGVHFEMGDLEDLLQGGFSDFFYRIFGGMPGGTGQGPFTQRERPRPQHIYEQPVTISLKEALYGATRQVQFNGRRLEVKIPAGARTGTKVRMSGAGPRQVNGKPSDLFLVVQVQPEPNFDRRQDDLYTDIQINLYTAVLGGEVRVPTLEGDLILTIPAGTQPNQTFRMRGRGMPLLSNPNKRGDLYVCTKVDIPIKLNSKQRQLFEQLARLSS